MITSFCEQAWDAVSQTELFARNIIGPGEDREVWLAPWTDEKFAEQESIYAEGWQKLCAEWRSTDFVETNSLMHGVDWEYTQTSLLETTQSAPTGESDDKSSYLESTDDCDADARDNNCDINEKLKKKSGPPLPKTPGFNELNNRVNAEKKEGRKPNISQLCKEIAPKYQVEDSALRQAWARWIKAKDCRET